MGQSVRIAPWLPTMDSPSPVTHAARLVIAARTTLIVDVTKAVIPWVVMEGMVEESTLIVAKVIVTLTIVKVTEARAQEMRAKEVRAKERRAKEVRAKEVRAKEVRAKEVRAKEVRAKEVWAPKQTAIYVTVKEVTSIVSASQMMAKTIGATLGQHLPSDITSVISLTMQTLHRTTTSSTAPRQLSWPRIMLITKSTRRQLWSIQVPRGTCSTICLSSTNSSLSHPCACLLTTMNMKMSMPKDPRQRRQSMLKTVTITLAMSKARRWRRWKTFDAIRYATVHRHRHGIFPHMQLIPQTRRLSRRL
jgi:hypothetical protein